MIFAINILVIFGIKALFADGMLLSNFKYTLFNLYSRKRFKTSYFELDEIQERKLKFTFKPIFLCPPCMSSIWGTAAFLFTGYEWYYLPIYVLSLTGAIYLIVKFMPE